jgi:hypothetical protein
MRYHFRELTSGRVVAISKGREAGADKMTIINRHEIALLRAGDGRKQAIEMLHKSGRVDAEQLQRLVGQRCKFQDRLYEIATVYYTFGGYISAKGYRILDDGKRGTKIWNIGALTPELFEEL